MFILFILITGSKNIETHSKCVEIGYNGAGFSNNINLFSQGIVIAMDHNNESFFL